ncbi:MAG TPA: hypothetical protein DCG34_05795 [Clostridiales bacterium]|nr:hypothetical protein [Clostridiales bacterium]
MEACQELDDSTEGIAYLIALDSSFSNREYKLVPAGTVVGRDISQCDIVAAGTTISRRHFRIEFDVDQAKYRLIDLDSKNGVFVNGQRVTSFELEDRDVIGLGSSFINHLRFQLSSSKSTSWTTQLPPRQSWVIGRINKVDIALPFEPIVSGCHAELTNRSGRLFIKDNGSLNGTWLNGFRVRKATEINFTDTIVIGNTSFHFQLNSDGALSVNQLEGGDDIKLECVGLTYELPRVKGKNSKILDNISLSLKAGEFVGILGPSGAGKTSFLKALNGYIPPTSGCVLLNETPLYQAFEMFRDSIGYVPQDDILYTELTVLKSLEYVAQLRLPPDLPVEQRNNIIDSTIEALGLSHVRNQRIHLLSGGQRKRVSIAAELITRPSILFLDEPTSGLDPCVEEKLMRHFQEMARKGTTVLITTHILYNLSMLDRVIVLSRGRLVFFGKPDEALAFFKNSAPSIERPAQIFDVLEAEIDLELQNIPKQNQDVKRALADSFASAYEKSHYFYKNISREFSTFGRELFNIKELRDKSLESAESNPQYKQLLAKPLAEQQRRIRLGDLLSLRSWTILSRRHLDVRFSFLKRSIVYLLIPILLALITISQNISGFITDDEVDGRLHLINTQINSGGIAFENQIKSLLSPDGYKDQRSASQIIYAIRHEGVANLPIPISVLLMFVMAGVFLGTTISCLEISGERTIYQRERMSHQRILDYIGSKLPFCLSVTFFQCFIFTSVCFLDPHIRNIQFFALILAMVSIAWTSVAIGLCVSTLDPSPGQYSFVLAILVVLPQLILSGGLGPDFYNGMGTTMKYFANMLPARWGLELLFSVIYFDQPFESTHWIPGFVQKALGFNFGSNVYWRCLSILFAQAASWIFCCAWILRRRDNIR